MIVKGQVHMIRKIFNVTDEVKRYVNIYIIVGEQCYLIDTGVAGTEELIEDYLKSINKNINDIKGIFLTHSHPDHIGSAKKIKEISGCMVYAPKEEVEWIENIEKQYKERPIPNFYSLLNESVVVDVPLEDGQIFELENGITIKGFSTKGHSQGSISYILNEEIIFTGDAVPLKDDLPIFVDYDETIKSIDRLYDLPQIKYFCPAWDNVRSKEEFIRVLLDSKKMLIKLKQVVYKVKIERKALIVDDMIEEVLCQMGMTQYKGNVLVIKSIEACFKNNSKDFIDIKTI